MAQYIIEESPLSKFLFANTRMAWVWLVVRLYVGWQWLVAGWEKFNNPVWNSPQAGAAIQGFIKGALGKVDGPHPDVSGWYAYFLEHAVLPHAALWSQMVTYGEILVGVGLIVGAFTGIAAFFGLFMNLNYLLAGTVSTNPILFTLSIGIMFAWRIAGYIGVDRYLIPLIGTPWKSGTLFSQK